MADQTWGQNWGGYGSFFVSMARSRRRLDPANLQFSYNNVFAWPGTDETYTEMSPHDFAARQWDSLLAKDDVAQAVRDSGYDGQAVCHIRRTDKVMTTQMPQAKPEAHDLPAYYWKDCAPPSVWLCTDCPTACDVMRQHGLNVSTDSSEKRGDDAQYNAWVGLRKRTAGDLMTYLKIIETMRLAPLMIGCRASSLFCHAMLLNSNSINLMDQEQYKGFLCFTHENAPAEPVRLWPSRMINLIPWDAVPPILVKDHVCFDFQLAPDMSTLPKKWWAHHRIREAWNADFAWIRRSQHFDTCTCHACRLLDTMKTTYVSDWIARIVGHPVKAGDMHCALMEPSHSVGIHEDQGKGDYAVVWYLNDSDGGELMLPNSSSYIQPKKNMAVLFTVPQPHYVKSPDTDRYSCTTWFSNA